MGKLWPTGQIHFLGLLACLFVCLFVAYELRLVFIFLKGCKQRNKNMQPKDLIWPAEPKMITIKALIEEVGQPLILTPSLLLPVFRVNSFLLCSSSPLSSRLYWLHSWLFPLGLRWYFFLEMLTLKYAFYSLLKNLFRKKFKWRWYVEFS